LNSLRISSSLTRLERIAVASPLELEIRSRLSAVLAGEANLRDFSNWLIPVTLEVERVENLGTIRLANELGHLFAELSAGMLTGPELRQGLVNAASTYLVTETPWNRAAGPPTSTRSSSDTIGDCPAAILLGRRRAEALA
jgi:hypothetical protein